MSRDACCSYESDNATYCEYGGGATVEHKKDRNYAGVQTWVRIVMHKSMTVMVMAAVVIHGAEPSETDATTITTIVTARLENVADRVTLRSCRLRNGRILRWVMQLVVHRSQHVVGWHDVRCDDAARGR